MNSLRFLPAGRARLRLAGSTATYLRPLLPITAPRPPRAAWRAGWRACSWSVHATDAPLSSISPARPDRDERRALRILRGEVVDQRIVPAALAVVGGDKLQRAFRADVQAPALAPILGWPFTTKCSTSMQGLPPAFAFLMPPVSGLFAPIRAPRGGGGGSAAGPKPGGSSRPGWPGRPAGFRGLGHDVVLRSLRGPVFPHAVDVDADAVVGDELEVLDRLRDRHIGQALLPAGRTARVRPPHQVRSDLAPAPRTAPGAWSPRVEPRSTASVRREKLATLEMITLSAGRALIGAGREWP